jgi:hypothetical protein
MLSVKSTITLFVIEFCFRINDYNFSLPSASDKPDLGLEELSSLNVKSRYQVFEKSETGPEVERSPSSVSVKRSPSILSKLAK